MNLCVDIGNTSSRVAVFDERELIWSDNLDNSKNLTAQLDHLQIQTCYISNVGKQQTMRAELDKFNPITVSHKTSIPIELEYSTPETLGTDRICAAVGSHAVFPDSYVLSIDIGTCIKYELVTPQGMYKGGNISPGMDMRYQALSGMTANLPLIQPDNIRSMIGSSTEEAIRNGVQLGIEGEIEAMITRLSSLYPDLKVIISGGNSSHFEKVLKTPIFAHPLLVLQGLNEIILHNHS